MNTESFGEHIEELGLAYLENILTPEERSKFEAHLNKCSDCAAEMEELTRWVNLLENNKHALCPEQWQLFDYARGVEDTRVLAGHLDSCPSCRSTVEEFKSAAVKEGVPDDLWQKMTGVSAWPVSKASKLRHEWIYDLWERFSDFFRAPLFAAAAVAATILLVVFLYPFGPSGPVLGLSSVAWTPGSSTMKLMGTPQAEAPADATRKDRLAIIIYFKDFKREPSQERIDSFYRRLEPGRNARLRFDLVSPGQVKEIVEKADSKAHEKDGLLSLLKERLDVSQALIIDLSAKGDQFQIKAQLTDTATGHVTRESAIKTASDADLAVDMEDAANSVLEAK